MQPIRITSGPTTRRRKWDQLHFDEEPKVQEGQQVKD